MRKLPLLVVASLAGWAGCVDGSKPTTPVATITATHVRAFVPYAKPTGSGYSDRFMALWNDMHDPKNGYFSPSGIPYHAVETLLAEAPDYGHETTSEAYSYWIWLEAMYGRITKDWSYLNDAWTNLETNIIPSPADQPSVAYYNPSAPAQFSPDLDHPSQYPSTLDPAAPVGADPIANELKGAYGDSNVYAMHWLIDVDNWYGFGRRGDGVGRPAYINTFQRGPEESVFEVIPQPSWDDLHWGGPKGYLDLFGAGGDPQWRYSVAPDADARTIQIIYWAKRWADEGGKGSDIASVVTKSTKLGDFMRYALFDKYFKVPGCSNPGCPGGSGRAAQHYLLAWYYAWGGAIGAQWSWRIGSSAMHSGYQNPMAAYALSTVADMRPKSPTAWGDWARSLERQLELYRWLQSSEGAIAGGVTNGLNGRYDAPPAGSKTFYGLVFDPSPVFRDPPSNEWFGFQAWSMERVAEYYYVSADKRAEVVLSKWVAWVKKNTTLTADGFSIPSNLEWSGTPAGSCDASSPAGDNPELHVKIRDSGEDVGVAASLAKALSFYAARSGDKPSYQLAKDLLDRSWKKYRDPKGVATSETRKDYKRFGEPLVLPGGWNGKMPNGDAIDKSSTFLSIRSKYKADPDWPRVEAYLKGGEAPKFTYHRFWAQSEIATANAVFGWLFPAAATPP